MVVFGAVLGGYLMEHGNVKVLLQPAELLIIARRVDWNGVDRQSAAHSEADLRREWRGRFAGSHFTKQRYIETLKMMYDLFNKARKDGLMGIESDVEEPAKSPVFSQASEISLKTTTFAHSFATRCGWR